jgi:glycosyltransferase involved in cell wall biosynthesis
MKGLVVIPAFNEATVIEKVIRQLPKFLDKDKLEVVVIDDGSRDDTSKVLKKLRVKTLTHPINRGLGAALGTGFEFARINNYDFLVTLDADGQHDPKELIRIARPILNKKADFVIGTRFFKKGMPVTRRVLTFLASLITFGFTGVWTTDSQSGYRAFSKKAISKIYIDVDRMEVSTSFFEQAKKYNLLIKEIDITPIYTKYSLTKGQNVLNSVNIVGKLLFRKLTV